MNQFKEDFNFISQLAQDFFDQDEIIRKLLLFKNKKLAIKGWEIWFQVEFALFLQNHPLVAEVEREKKFKMDFDMTITEALSMSRAEMESIMEDILNETN